MNASDKAANKYKEILIVEDSLTQAEQLRHILEKRGYRTTIAVDGRKALTYLAKNKPFIIISDILMPEMDGYELCSRVKSNEKLKDIPVILLTSLANPQDIIKGLISGADNFMVKPYDENYLISRIEYIRANQELRKHEKSRLGVEISFGGRRHTITSDRLQIIDLLISTYETAIQKNHELERAKKELEILNSRLEYKVQERTAELSEEIERRIVVEEKLRKLNRIYKVTSNINQSIIRCQDEQSLFNEVCKIAADDGKFKMVLIWKFDEQNQKIKVVANKGINILDRYSEIDLSDKKNKIDPVIEALNSKKCIINNDLSEVYSFSSELNAQPFDNTIDSVKLELFAQIALENGCNSVCTVPIIVYDKPYGAIKLFHEQKNFFDKDEVILLEEMGKDVSFCIETLISEEKRIRAEKSLAQAEEKYRDLVENINDIIFLLGTDSLIEYISPAVEDILHYKPEELIGKSFHELIPEDKLEIAEETYRKFLSGESEPVVIKLLTKDNELRWLRVSAKPIISGNPTSSIRGVMTDVTELHYKELDLIRAKEKAEESNKLKTEFLAQMSHEIRTPLNIMLSYSEVLKEEFDLENDPDKKEIYDIITFSGKRLVRTVDSILNMSELQVGAYEATYISFDIYKGILLPLYKEYQLNADEKNLTFILNKYTDNTIINIDEYSVSQIFSNLIDNAIKYTLKGSIEIVIKRNTENLLYVEVRDTGIGIAEEFLPHLFEPFRQEEQGYTRKFEGNGLGLAIVKKYCEINSAKIEVESKKNTGTTFRVTFMKN